MVHGLPSSEMAAHTPSNEFKNFAPLDRYRLEGASSLSEWTARSSFLSTEFTPGRRAWYSEPIEIVPAVLCSPLESLDSALTTYFTSPGSRKQTLAVLLGPSFAEYSLRLVPNPIIPPKWRWQARFSVMGFKKITRTVP